MINIILCGGSGTRLWPLSRTSFPKQFVRLFDNKSLFQKTLQRNINVCDKTLIVSNIEQYFLALDQVNEIDLNIYKYVLESAARNTAPAIALACLAVNPEDIVLVTPSDHLIKNQYAYEETVQRAEYLAQQGNIVTFGINPTRAETGYGYIHADGEEVISFKEKPNLETAKEYIKDQNYFWNAGIFCFKANVYLDELKKYSPEIYHKSLDAYPKNSSIKVEIEKQNMLDIPSNSIDYAVIEKSSKVKVVCCNNIEWSDLGSFDSLDEEVSKNKVDNSLIKKKGVNDPAIINSYNNLVVAESRQIAMIDVENLLVVDTPDALLISKKGCSQKVKNVLEMVKLRDSDLAEKHTTVYRPWGCYQILINMKCYKVKKIMLNPKKELTLQKHFYRSEHWVVLSGVATVTLGIEELTLYRNQSAYIDVGKQHKLENRQDIPLEIIEIQVGDNVTEDDIITLN